MKEKQLKYENEDELWPILGLKRSGRRIEWSRQSEIWDKNTKVLFLLHS